MTRNGTVNPFEPWRPVEVHVPPTLNAGRPWRPPSPPPARAAAEALPSVVPVDRPQRNKPPERPKRSQGQGGQDPCGRTPISHWGAFVVISLLGVVCIDCVGWYRVTHLPRLIALGASAAIFVGMAFNYRRSWYARLRGMAIALALAGIAVWLMPTTHGVNLWSAYRQIEELRSLPAGDIDAYQRGAADRQILVEEFPSFSADVSAAEQAWLRRTVDEAIENADRRAKTDPQAALAQLQQVDKELSGLEHYASVKSELDSARRRTLQACLKVALRR